MIQTSLTKTEWFDHHQGITCQFMHLPRNFSRVLTNAVKARFLLIHLLPTLKYLFRLGDCLETWPSILVGFSSMKFFRT